MMLIDCPECHGKVSDSAICCPHCGNVNLSTTKNNSANKRPKRENEMPRVMLALGIPFSALGIFAALAIAAVCNRLGRPGVAAIFFVGCMVNLWGLWRGKTSNAYLPPLVCGIAFAFFLLDGNPLLPTCVIGGGIVAVLLSLAIVINRNATIQSWASVKRRKQFAVKL